MVWGNGWCRSFRRVLCSCHATSFPHPPGNPLPLFWHFVLRPWEICNCACKSIGSVIVRIWFGFGVLSLAARRRAEAGHAAWVRRVRCFRLGVKGGTYAMVGSVGGATAATDARTYHCDLFLNYVFCFFILPPFVLPPSGGL